MKLLLFLCALLPALCAQAQAPTETYPDDPASIEHPGVPKGEILKFEFSSSKIFPNTWREVSVYVPDQYRPAQPACVYVNQDGIQWKAPTVFDNLIAKKEMPVTVGVFVTPGRVRAANGEALDRFNRSFEYDGLGDGYARFILDEILPEVEKLKTSDGRAIRLSQSGNDRAIGGSSSGAVCAFTAAWERPDAFSRVFSAIGTYVGLRGADRYPALVRKYEPKPIRVFLQDGAADLNIYAGDWWMANQAMDRALTFAGYETQHVWGEGGHNGKQGTAVFPEAMRFLWHGWPKAVAKGASKNQFLTDLLIPGEDWQVVGEGYKFTEGTAVNAKGEVFFQDIPNGKTYTLDAGGKPVALAIDSKKVSGTAYGPDGRRYSTGAGPKQVLVHDAAGAETVLAEEAGGNDITVDHRGNVYLTLPDGREKPSKLLLIRPSGEKVVVDEGVSTPGLKFANGLCLSPDQTQLYVTESASHWVWAYQIQPDGTLGAKQRFGHLHVPDWEENAWSDGLKCDRDGRVYVSTRIGIQVMDQLGRVNAILPAPKASGQTSNLVFGGPAFDVMYVSSGDKVFRRKLKTKGVNGWDAPSKPTAPRL